ncbi:hypothetical protein HanRHA438_Chr09g0392361 [Helianthus annuus]|nr:hypothetical protein HanIR_Chr09g0410321 [Helianthus annuus]KAJ0541863.1 hypothetical protein HanHA89_Chr09g0333381 [Helianthus annuus]KAJ0706938.1 hypothetical protein HanLR1_Chr09g0312831 [Helianthus annuus]KAJ0710957.1 hypothetical protein HanOQP8_Chr09g0318401 [Helianthus annuus]KAJ0887572.1 hypothetical protein HanRHA438_Chr09g0392361 [Helianthus annuus]
MANPFASSKQPSLFPMTIPSLDISKDEYRLFYQYERALFKIFLLFLQREVVEATLVIGFLLWLERGGYTSNPLGKMFINFLSPNAINEVADEALICIKFLQKKANNLMFEGSNNSYNITKLQCFLDRKHINFDELNLYGDLICNEVCCIAKDISVKALDDILEQFTIHSETPTMYPHQDPIVANGFGDLRYMGTAVGFQQVPSAGVANQDTKFVQNYQMAQQYQNQQMVRQSTCLGHNHTYVGGRTFLNHTRLVERGLDKEVPPDDRTIFLTFSKGYPLSEYEIKDYFCRMFGDIIQSLHMQPVEAGTQPLFARIVVRNPSSLKAVIGKDGLQGKSKYVINGKHVWARKFVPRTP